MKNIGIFQIDTIPGHFTCNVFRKSFLAFWSLILCKLFILIKKWSIEVKKSLIKHLLPQRIKMQQQKRMGYNQVPTYCPLISLSFKNITCKMSRMVSIKKIPIFFISMSQKNYLRHMHEWGVKKIAKGHRIWYKKLN